MRLIDADSLLAKLHNTTFEEDARPAVYRAITEEKAVDAVPVIRCKDCKYFEKLSFDSAKRCQYYGEIGDDHEWGEIDGKFFCGHAERREE